MTGERNLIRAGYRFDVIADFSDNAGKVRIAIRKTNRGAQRFAEKFRSVNRRIVVAVWVMLRHDPLLDDEMNKRSKSR